MDLLRSAYGSDSEGEVGALLCDAMRATRRPRVIIPSHPSHTPYRTPQPQAPPAVAAAAAPASPSKRKRGGKGGAVAAPAPQALPAVPVQLVSRTVNSAPFVNPALKTVLNRPGFIPPTQTQLTTNVKVRACVRALGSCLSGVDGHA